MKTTLATAGAVLILAALTGCGSNTVTPAAANSTAPAAPAAAAATTSAPPAQGVAKWGDTVTFPNGIKVTVTPAVVPAAQYAAGAIEGKIVTFDLTVTNTSKDQFNAALMGYPKISYGATGTQAPSATDIQSGIGAGSLSTILPGESQTVKLGAGIPSASFGDVRVEVSGPTYGTQPAIFKGAVQ